MRIRPRCPASLLSLHGQIMHLLGTNGHVKVFFSVLLLAAALLVVTITIMEIRSSWQLRDVVVGRDPQMLSRKKFSVAIATDVSNGQLRYGVVIDCGSSGSRVYVYYWPPHTGNPKELLNVQHMRDKWGSQVVKKITPGLSAYEMKPAEASDYLRPLLQYAAGQVPADKHAETPLYIMATAGLRMLGDSEQKAIMDDLRVDIRLNFRFMFVETHAEVISGKQEGVYAWIALNYVLGKFDHSIMARGGRVAVVAEAAMPMVEVQGQDHATHFRKQTTGVLDMGGGSLQVAYEVPHSDDMAKSLLAEFNLGCRASDFDHTYRVYVSTFLGFGGNSARRRYVQHLVTMAMSKVGARNLTNSSTAGLPGQSVASPIRDPCLPVGLGETAVHRDLKLHLRGTGDYDTCLNLVKPLLNSTNHCSKPPCSMNGVYQPRIDFAFSEFYGFSEFYYTSHDLLRLGGKYKYLKFHKAAMELCGTRWSALQDAFDNKRFPHADYNRFKYQCFKSAWVSLVLHDGLHLPRSYPSFTSVQLIDGKEVHWTLGALLYKTRYFPLSAIQQRTVHSHHGSWWAVGQLQHSPYIIILCILVVAAAIFIYLRRLRIVRSPNLRKTASMSYFMADDSQVEQGIVTVHDVMP